MIGGLIGGVFRLLFGGRSMFGIGGMIKLLIVMFVVVTLLRSCAGKSSIPSSSLGLPVSSRGNFNAPVQTPPSFGKPHYFMNGDMSSRLQITTPPGLNYFVTLTDNSSGAKCLEVFLQGGQNSEFPVPLGDYEIIYAAGTTWYGEDNLFGPETRKARANGVASFKRGSVITLNITQGAR